jgi:hypothetical protein
VDSDPVPSSVPSRQLSLARPLLKLAAILAALWPIAAAYGWWRAEWNGVAASVATLGVCGLAAGVSLAVAVGSQMAKQPISGVLGGMAVRMVVPLLALVAAAKLGPAWTSAGFGELLLGYYLAALAVETWILVRLVPADAASVAKAT